MVPECYDPIYQEERRQKAWDEYADLLPVCELCGRRMYPGDRFHEVRHRKFCAACVDDLVENEDIVEVD